MNALEFITRFLWYCLEGAVKALLPFSMIRHKNVSGEVVLITGAGSGLGRELAKRFFKEGAMLVLWDLNAQLNAETQRILEEISPKGKVVAQSVDVSDRAQVYEAARQVLDELGRVDILVNNAGIVNGKKLMDTPDEVIDKVMAVNAVSLFTLAKAFVPRMVERDHGHIVTVASMAGKVGVCGMADYSASKFAAVGFAESLRSELRERSANLHVTLICPYYINTGMFDGVQPSSPLLLPILEPADAAERIFHAILTEMPIYQLPKFTYLPMALKNILPTKAIDLIALYIGVNKEMESFRGRKPLAN